MRASLALHQGVLFVATAERTAHVRLFDLDGHRLEGGFDFQPECHDERTATAVASSAWGAPDAIAVDDDRRLWLADPLLEQVRCFTVFGVESARLGPRDPARAGRFAPDVAGVLARPRALAAAGAAEDLRLLVGSADERRHALHLFGPGGELLRSLRPGGDPHGRFRGIEAVAMSSERIFAAERARAGQPERVQVFRALRHHFSFDLSSSNGGGGRATSMAALPDGRLLIAFSGEPSRLALFDAGGRFERVLVGPGTGPGQVSEPSGVAVEWTGVERTSRVAVIDADGSRIQVFSLDGRCFGEFEEALA